MVHYFLVPGRSWSLNSKSCEWERLRLYLGFWYRFSHCETNSLGERTVGCLRFLKNVANQAQSTKLSLLKSVHYLVVNSTLQELLIMWLDRYVVLHKHIRLGVHLCERLRLRWCRGGALERVWWRQICAAAQRTLGKRRHGSQVLHQEERTRGKNRNWSRESAWNLLTFGWRDESCREGGWHRLLLSGCINQMHRLQKANDVSFFSSSQQKKHWNFSFWFFNKWPVSSSQIIISTNTYSIIYFETYILHIEQSAWYKN